MAARKKASTKVRDGVAKRPAGSTAAVTSLVVLVLSWFDVEMEPEEVVVLIGGLTALASMVFTRS